MANLVFSFLTLLLLLSQAAMSVGDSNNAADAQVTTGKILSFDHLRYSVGNAKQAAYYWCVKFGFRPSAYAGLETGSRNSASHVVTQGDITLVFQTSLSPGISDDTTKAEGDGLTDVAFVVDDVDAMFKKALAGGARSKRKPFTLNDPKDGEVRLATVVIVDGYTHTFVDRSRYSGIFLPGYDQAVLDDTLVSELPEVGLTKIDYVGIMLLKGSIKNVTSSYKKALGFLDYVFMIDPPIHTDDLQDSAAVFLSNDDQSVPMAFVEPFHLATNFTHYLDEFSFYKGGSGPIDTSFLTHDLVKAVKSMRQRGETFVNIQPDYYDALKEKVDASSVKPNFSIDELKSLDILLDFSDDGKNYQLDAVTALPQDTPTYLLLLKQRVGDLSFSINNYNAMYTALEMDQDERGNL